MGVDWRQARCIKLLYFSVLHVCDPLIWGCVETAINIGYSSRLLTDDMTRFDIDKDSKEEVCQQLREANKQMKDHSKSPDASGSDETASFGIVINGHSLVCLPLCTQITHL